MLPLWFASPVAGVLVDRFSRRRIMLISDGVRLGVVLCMLGLSVFPSVSLLYALVIGQTLAAAFFEPARSALLPDIVRPEELTAANAMGAAMWSTMLALGSAAGGLLTATLGWQAALVVDALSYLLSMWLLYGIREPELDLPGLGEGVLPAVVDGFGQLVYGARYVWERPRVLTLALVKGGWCLAGSMTLVLTLLGEQKWPVAGSTVLGVTVLYVARGIGTGMGPFGARALSHSVPSAMERMIGYGFVMGAAFYLLLPFSPNLLVAAVVVALAHLGGATVWVFSSIRLQQLVPTEVRGRVFAFENAMFTVVMSVSTGVYGVLVDKGLVSLEQLTGSLGGLLSISAVLWWARGRRYGWATEARQADA
jgi:MFS family permease